MAIILTIPQILGLPFSQEEAILSLLHYGQA